MKNILIICNTYYQLIFAINLGICIFNNDQVSIILTDQSRNARTIASNLKKENIFKKVIYITSKSFDRKHNSLLEKCKYAYDTILGRFKPLEDELKNIVVDDLLFYNMTAMTFSIYHRLLRNNKHLQCACIEEGVISYNTTFKIDQNTQRGSMFRFIDSVDTSLHRKSIYMATNDFYCFYPELYRGPLNAIKVPSIDLNNKNIVDTITRVFSVQRDDLCFKEKYIYFASVGDFEGSERAGELELAKVIADKVGKDNLLIKVHPRDNTGEFEKSGLNVYPGSDVPWEAIQLNYDFSNHVFLTCTSGSVLSVNMMLEKGPEVYFLYNLCNARNNDMISKSIPTIESLVKTEIASKKNIFIADSLDEIVS